MKVHGGFLTVPAGAGSQTVRFDYSVYTELLASYPSYDALLAGETTYNGMLAGGGSFGTPQVLLFFGTNFTAEDTPLTSSGLGLFRGMCAPKWDAPGTLVQNASCVIAAPAGNAHNETDGSAIVQLNTSGAHVALYYAQVTSLDPDGFTLNWSQGAAGGYKVAYVAINGLAHVGARVGLFDGTTINLGWKAGAAVLHGTWGGPNLGSPDRNQSFYGGAAYPGTATGGWSSASATIAATEVSGSYINELTAFVPTTKTATGMHGGIASSFVSSNILTHPVAGALTTFRFAGDSQDGGMVVMWDEEHTRGFYQAPAQAQGATSTKTGLPFAPELLLGYTISNEPSGQGVGGRGAIGLCVVTPTFQWCATVDGHSAVGSFQSFQRGFCDTVNGTAAHAGTVALTADGFVLTTEEDDTPLSSVVWQAFGRPLVRALWIPQIYRRILSI